MKLTNLILIISGLMVLFFLAGLNTSLGYVLGTLNIVNHPGGLVGSTLYVIVYAAIAGSLAVGLAVGFFTKSPVENILIVPAVLLFALFLSDLLSIVSITGAACGVGSSCEWIYWIVVAIIVPISIAFLMALIDWWRGRDS